METLLLWMFYLTSLYAFIPGLISRLFGFRVFRRGVSKEHFALTFDDGPDAVYTAQLLDLLKRYDAKATFFVVGENAEKHPEMLSRMHEEGHLIGIHNYIHKTNWLMSPKEVRKQIQSTTKIIRDVTGMTTHFYRPPWGIANIFDFAKRNETQIVLWSGMFGDWRLRVGAERLSKRMMKKLRGGEVFLLHDCGATLGANVGAPGEMLIALEQVLEEASKQGLSSVRIDELIAETEKTTGKKTSLSSYLEEKASGKPVVSRSKKAIVFLWLLWEKLFHFVFNLKSTSDEDPFLYFRVTTYHGETVMMNGNQREVPLNHGDKVLELHFDNKRLFNIGMSSRTSLHLAIQMIRAMEKTLPELASHMASHPEFGDVKALYGVSMINRGPEQFGFTVVDLPKGLFASSSRIYLKFLMSVIHPDGVSRVKQSDSKKARQLDPKMILMPTDILLQKYLPDSSGYRSYEDHHQQASATEEEEDEAVLPVGVRS